MKKKIDFINKLSLVDKIYIEEKTREQNQNFEWFQERKIRLTASKFGEVCKMKPYTSCKKKVHSMLYKLPAKSKEMNHGIEFESHARKQFENMFNLKVKLCGLIIDPELPYLAASPGIIYLLLIYKYSFTSTFPLINKGIRTLYFIVWINYF